MIPRTILCCLIVLLLQPTLVFSFFLQNVLKAPTPPTRSLIADLEGLIEQVQDQREKTASMELEEEIKSLMTLISESRKGDQRMSLPGRWELIYTTEKEVNFFNTSWPFAKVSSITQDIDPYKRCALNNLISFEGGGEFSVTGRVVPAEGSDVYDRVEFSFNEAFVRGWGREVKVPPVGAGWFDTIFCDGTYRLSRDSRGDWSVFRKLSQ